MSNEDIPVAVQPTIELQRPGILFILSAPSGAGKTTLAHRVLAVLPDVVLSVSFTTRSPRPGETDGRDYRFVTEKEFLEMEKMGCFAESAVVHGARYGTPAEPLIKNVQEGRDVLLDIDVKGTMQVKQRYCDSVAIFLFPPSREVLLERLRGRGTDLSEGIEQRFQNAQAEIQQIELYDFVVINKDIQRAVDGVVAIINAERHRVSRIRNLRSLSWNSAS